jgi:hypothetical protein
VNESFTAAISLKNGDCRSLANLCLGNTIGLYGTIVADENDDNDDDDDDDCLQVFRLLVISFMVLILIRIHLNESIWIIGFCRNTDEALNAQIVPESVDKLNSSILLQLVDSDIVDMGNIRNTWKKSLLITGANRFMLMTQRQMF